MAAKKKQFNVVDWTVKSGKSEVMSWTQKETLIAYLKDLLTHMEKGTVTKFEVFYSDKVAKKKNK
jgi:hypothetical protein